MITKELLVKLRPEINEALRAVGEKNNVVLTLGNGRFDENGVTFKLNVMPVTKDGTVITPGIKEWNRYAVSYGFSKDDLGRVFFSNQQLFTICGLNPRKRKYPILAKVSSGQVYCFGVEYVRAVLSKGQTSKP